MWSGCSNCHIKTSGEQGKFVDAFSKVSTHIRLMYTENHDGSPQWNHANGTMCHLVKVLLHTDVTENNFRILNIDGYHVRTIDATKVDYLLWRVCQNQLMEPLSRYRSGRQNCSLIQTLTNVITHNNEPLKL